MKKTRKLLSVFLAFVLVLGSMSTALSASAAEYYKVKDFRLSAEQSATLLLDYVDDMLADMATQGEASSDSIPGIVEYSIGNGQITASLGTGLLKKEILIDYTSIDNVLSTVPAALDSLQTLLTGFGDAADIRYDMLKNVQRSGGDLNVVYALLEFLSANSGIIVKAIDGTLSLGIADAAFNVNEEISKALSNATGGQASDIPGFIRYSLYDVMLGDRLGYPAAMSESGLPTADEIINAFLNAYLTTDATTDFNGKALLPSLAGQINVSSGTVYDFLAQALEAAYADLAQTPFNNDIKALLLEYACGAVKTDITASVTEEQKALVAESETNPATALTSSGFAAVDGGYLFRSGASYYMLDTSAVNSMFEVFDFNYKLPETLDMIAEDGTMTSRINDLLGTVITTVLSDAYDEKVNWQMGGNELLVENLANTAKAILPVCPDSFFEGFLDQATIDQIKNPAADADPMELINYFVNVLVQVLVPDVRDELADADKFMEVGAVIANHYAKTVSPTIDYSAEIYNGDAIAEKTDQEWVDLLMNLGMEVAVYYLDLSTNIDVDTDKMAEYKTAAASAGVTLADFLLDDVVDWAFSYADGVFAAGDDLAGERGVYDGNGGWYKLNVIVNDIFPLQFMNGTSETSEFAVDMEYTMNEMITKALNLDVAGAVAVIARNDNEGNILNDTPVTAILKVVQGLINSILPNTIETQYLTNVETFIGTNSLKALVKNLLTSLNDRADKILPAVLPVVVSFLDDFVDDTSLVLEAYENTDENCVEFVSILSQSYAKSFGVADGVASGTPENVTIKRAGTLIAGGNYMKEQGLDTLTLADADNANVFNVVTYKIYIDNATAENDGYYTFNARVSGINDLAEDKEFYAISYITYAVGSAEQTVYAVNGFTINLDVAGV